MPDGLEEMPLFPLETVLFPGAALQLHIFEDRYREMVHSCIEKERPFGIVLIRSGQAVGGPAEPYMVGTAVSIQQVHTYSDGRMDIQVQGERRFRIRKLDYSQPYLVGWVEPVDETDLPISAENEELVNRAKLGLQALIHSILARPEYNVEVVFPPDATTLSYTIANMLQIEMREKQRLLEITDTELRLRELMPVLQHHLDEIESYQEMYESIQQSKIHRLTHDDLREWSGPN